jgi:hypothetical protein
MTYCPKTRLFTELRRECRDAESLTLLESTRLSLVDEPRPVVTAPPPPPTMTDWTSRLVGLIQSESEHCRTCAARFGLFSRARRCEACQELFCHLHFSSSRCLQCTTLFVLQDMGVRRREIHIARDTSTVRKLYEKEVTGPRREVLGLVTQIHLLLQPEHQSLRAARVLLARLDTLLAESFRMTEHLPRTTATEIALASAVGTLLDQWGLDMRTTFLSLKEEMITREYSLLTFVHASVFGIWSDARQHGLFSEHYRPAFETALSVIESNRSVLSASVEMEEEEEKHIVPSPQAARMVEALLVRRVGSAFGKVWARWQETEMDDSPRTMETTRVLKALATGMEESFIRGDYDCLSS